MINGYERKMYYVRDTRSKIFREAYFVLRDGAEVSVFCESDLAAEADRILREHFPRKRRRLKRGSVTGAVIFLLGIAVGICITVMV